jgi:hypothetical protein
MKERFCKSCRRIVRVLVQEDIDGDESGLYEGIEYVCSECGERISRCIECAYFEVISDTVPWYNAVGKCKRLELLILAGNLVCPFFIEV